MTASFEKGPHPYMLRALTLNLYAVPILSPSVTEVYVPVNKLLDPIRSTLATPVPASQTRL